MATLKCSPFTEGPDPRFPRQRLEPPAAAGLYDPAHEHDACGVGFVVDIKGRRVARHRRARRCRCSMNLQHRGACGCEANTGDGAGILIQMPDALPAQGARRHRAAAGRRLRRRPGVPAARRRAIARAIEALVRARSSPRRASGCSAGATCRPTTARSARARWRSSRCSGRSSSARRRRRPAGRDGRDALRAQAVRHPQARRARRRRAARSPEARAALLHRQPVVARR